MQFLWMSLVPVAVFLSYFYRYFIGIFDSNNSRNQITKYESPDLWGTHRSNLYFGMRTKTPQALMTGLAWSSVDNIEGFSSKISGGIYKYLYIFFIY
jgi:hypothetical protein